MSIETLIDDFSFLEDWEERYRHVIELGRALAPLDPAVKTDANKVRGCASQVWLISDIDRTDPDDPRLFFRGESDAHIVQGLISVLLELYSGKHASEILNTDARAVFDRLGLIEALSAQRSNGLFSMVERIRADAAAALGTAPAPTRH